MTSEIVQADITTLRVDAIVNAANETLLGGGGVDGAIHRAASPHLLAACRAIPEAFPGVRCPTGEARITPGFELPARWVIHTVGPVWSGGRRGEDALLESCYRSCFALAISRQIRTIAFPSISTGAYRFPVERAAGIALRETVEAVSNYSGLHRVVFVCFSRHVYECYRHALAAEITRPAGASCRVKE